MATLFGEARGEFYAHAGRSELGGTIMVSMTIDYLAEAHYPQPLDMALGVAEIGRTSWVFQQLGRQNHQPVALCRAVLVLDKGRPTTAESEWKTVLAQYQLGSA